MQKLDLLTFFGKGCSLRIIKHFSFSHSFKISQKRSYICFLGSSVWRKLSNFHNLISRIDANALWAWTVPTWRIFLKMLAYCRVHSDSTIQQKISGLNETKKWSLTHSLSLFVQIHKLTRYWRWRPLNSQIRCRVFF